MAKQGEAQVKLSLIDKLSAPLTKIKARLASLGKSVGFDRVASQIKNVGSAFRNLGDGVTRSLGRISASAALLGASFGGIVAGAYNLAKHVADIGGDIDDTSNKLGTSRLALQQWQYVARMSGMEAEALHGAIAKLGVNAGSAIKGNKTMAASFKELGVRLKDSGGKIRSMDSLMEDVFLRLADIEDPITRNAAAVKLFGKSGAELGKMFAGGRTGIKELKEEALKLGFVLSDGAIKQAAEFGDSVDKLSLRLEGLKRRIGVELMPVINDLIDGISDWMKENNGLIKSQVTEWVRSFTSVMKDLMDPTSNIRRGIADLAAGFSSFVDKIQPVVDFLGGPLNAALAVIGVWALAPVITAVTGLAVAFSGLALAVGKVAASAIALSFAGFAKMFTGLAGEAATAGTAAGTKYGTSFGKSARKWIQLGLVGLGAWAAYELMKDVPDTVEGWKKLDAEKKKSDAAANKWLSTNIGDRIKNFTGLDIMPNDGKGDYENSMAKQLLDGIKKLVAAPAAPIEIGKQVAEVAKPPTVTNVISFDAALKAREAGIGGSTTDTAPGKMKDDLDIGRRPPGADAILGAVDGLKDAVAGLSKKVSLGGAIPKMDVPEIKVSAVTPSAVSNVIALDNAIRSRALGIGGSTTDTAPGKTKDDLGIGSGPRSINAASMNIGNVTMPEPIIAHQPQTVNAPFTVNLTINAQSNDPNAIGNAVKSALAAQAARHARDVTSTLSD